MGTRGLYGFFYNRKFYIIYNHFDSYYDGLGDALLNELRAALEKDRKLTAWIDQILQLKSTIDHTPTEQDIERLQKYSDLDVSSRDELDWYCLLRECQGSFIKVLDSGYIQEEIVTDFDAIYNKYGAGFCGIEYVYILNLTTSCFEYFSNHECPRYGSSKWHKIRFDDIIDDNFSDSHKWPDQIEIDEHEKIEESIKFKNYGNLLFKDNKFVDAIKQYKIALKWIDNEIFENDQYWRQHKEILIACNNNLCLGYAKLKNWESAIYHATATLEHDAKNIIALVRRAKSGLNDLDTWEIKEIKKDLEFAHSLNKNDLEIKKLLTIANQEEEKKYFKEQSNTFSKNVQK